MADVRPFRGLRFDPSLTDPALAIAPPYDVISPEEQLALYGRSANNIVRVEYGEQRVGDTASDNRYTRAARDLDDWRRSSVLVRDEHPAVYSYRQEFTWEGRQFARHHYFAAARLQDWKQGDIKPHEHTLSGPKADRMDLLRATRTQVSPVYCLYRRKGSGPPLSAIAGEVLCDFEADGQHHVLAALSDAGALASLSAYMADCDVYIADGHHRYETALNYRNECRDRAPSWSGDEPENFVLMALTDAADPGLLVLPTHRMVNPVSSPPDAMARIARHFRVEDVTPAAGAPGLASVLARLDAEKRGTAFLAIGLEPGRTHLLTLAGRAALETLMPSGQPDAWKRLDVSVLQYGILAHIFDIDDAALAAGGVVSYTQDPRAAFDAALDGRARVAFLLNATPVEQVLAVADVGGRMPQKSTYFYPKLPTGLVMNALDPD